MRALGGERAYKSRLGKDRSPGISSHSIASTEYASPPEAALPQTLQQRLRFPDLWHFQRRREAFDHWRKDGMSFG